MINAADKQLNRMDRLGDMGHFPAVVNAGATVNILVTLCVTWWLVPRFPQVYAPVVWSALVLVLNLLPVVLLRLSMRADDTYPTLRNMNFVRDQHRFSDWVYLAASANMAFWVLTSWALFSFRYQLSTLVFMLVIAAVATFSPVLLRAVRRS